LGAQYLLSLSISVGLALLVGAALMAAVGFSPLQGYGALVKGAFGTRRALGNTLAKTVTLSMTGLAMAVAAQAGIFNVGGEGQLYLGGLAAAVVGAAMLGAPPVVGIGLALLAAIVAGGLFALLPGWLKVRLGVNEVITTIMLNSAAIYFCGYMANGPLKTMDRGIASGTNAIDPAFVFPRLIPLSNLSTSVFYAAGLALLCWYLMKRATPGYEMKITGQNERFARYAGMPTGRLMLFAMVISGAICGLVGMFEVYGLHRRFIPTLSNEFYFDGMLVAMIMRYDPVGIVLMSVFFAAMKIGGLAMELQVGISSELVLIVQAIIIFFMAAEGGITNEIRARRARRAGRA
jgi:simple sugar transport system permease protein